MLRIAEAPSWDNENEGRTLTPYFAAQFFGIQLETMLSLCDSHNELVVPVSAPENSAGPRRGNYRVEILRGMIKQIDV